MTDSSEGGSTASARTGTKVPFGNRRAGVLCNMSRSARLDLLGEGLPIILASAQGFWNAAVELSDHPREARVLEGFCEEECAKIMILMDLVRCPRRIADKRVGKLVKVFYDHLGRLIYADAHGWKPMHMAQLREYVDHARVGHYLEGDMGEYIMPNWSRYSRESTMYADVEVHEDGVPRWNEPNRLGAITLAFPPLVLGLAEAMSAAGLFDRRGLKAVGDIWDQVEFVDEENFEDSQRLTRELFVRLDEEGLVTEAATDRHAGLLMNDWQMPMYNLDFRELPVPLEDLEAAREASFWAEVGVEQGGY